MSNLNFNENRIQFTPTVLYLDYIYLQYPNYLKKLH